MHYSTPHQSAMAWAGSSAGTEERRKGSIGSGELARRDCDELRQEFLVGGEV